MSAANFVKPICAGETVIDVIMQSAERASGVLGWWERKATEYFVKCSRAATMPGISYSFR